MRRSSLGAAMLVAAWLTTALGADGAPAPRVELEIEGRGKVVLELHPTDAPRTVAHFLDLVRRGFYTGIRFHRVRPGFVVQAGDPASRGLRAEDLAGKSDEELAAMNIGGGGSGRTVVFENSPRRHEPGALSLALSAPRSATGDSQFFINLVANPQLNGDYCVFGRVVQGMPVLRAIRQGDRIVRARLVTPAAPRAR
ncbi:MAG TPA: peptidylprolyl isomerase [Chthonomonadales bacterium]|nr:peptidylprolyl isomerase [Chthonomonadales bacterium]